MIDNVDFVNLRAEKYWSPTKGTDINALAKNLIFSGEYIGARKIDGHWAMLIKEGDGSLYLRGRDPSVSGEYLNKAEWVPQILEDFETYPPGTVLVGELFFPHNEGSKNVTTIMGCAKEKALIRQKVNKLSYYVFDILAYNGKSFLNIPLEGRL